MYSTCLFCHKSLGANEVIEHLPIGRRLAFDGARGRLWVVCPACRRWNLTPIEERWEAIEECERRYRTVRAQTSTDEIGLARLAEGLDLVRIGKPPRAELAAWQYVDIFRRRRQRAIIVTAAGATALLAFGAGWAAYAGLGALVQLGIQLGFQEWSGSERVAKVVGPDGKKFILNKNHLPSVRWVPQREDAPFALEIVRERLWRLPIETKLDGDLAARALRPILARMNRFAGRPQQIRLAVDQLNREGDPMAPDHSRFGSRSIPLTELNVADRLSFEMSLAERDEQKLLAGELAALTAAWREAEEIGAIADNLLLPESVIAWLRRHGH